MRLAQRLWRRVVAAALAVLAPALHAQQLPGAGSFAGGAAGEGHGWVLAGPADAPVLIHVPPRGSVDLGDGRELTSRGGAVRLATNLGAMPEAIAAWGRDAYLIFPPAGRGQRLVLRASVRPGPVGNLWELAQQERLDAAPSLAARGALAGFVGSDLGLLVLLSDSEGEGHVGLHGLVGGEWVDLQLPADLEGGEARLVAMPEGVGLFWEAGGGGTVLYRGRRGSGRSGMSWTSEPLPPIGLDAEAAPKTLWWFGGAVIFQQKTSDGLDLREVRPAGVTSLGVVTGVAPRYGVAPMPQSGRLVMVWTAGSGDTATPAPPAVASPPESRKYFVREISVFTGRVLYDGPPTESWPFSVLEFRLLALLLMAIVAGVLVFVLRPETGDGTVLLPTGTALAEPWRRAVAGAIDLGVAWLIVSWVIGITVESLLVPVLGEGMVPAILLVLVVACAHCTLGEWAVGRSLGKAIAGCRVARVGRAGNAGPGSEPPRAPTFRGALIRNLVRWGVPPLGIGGLTLPGGRHRGDVLARTAVVIPVEPDTGAEGG
jgi:hypothetical protein